MGNEFISSPDLFGVLFRLDAAIRNWERAGKPGGLESYARFLPECGECAEVA